MLQKRFIQMLGAISKNAERTAELAHEVCQLAIKAIYANKDGEMVEAILNSPGMPEFVRKSAFAWFKKFGVNVDAPLPGTKLYRVDGVINAKRQADVFGKIASTPVLVVEQVEARIKVDKPLEGTPESRAEKAVGKLVTRLKETDALAAALINDAFSRAAPQKLTVVGAEGSVVRIDAEEFDAILALIHKRRSGGL